MGKRIPMVNGDEHDAINRKWRHRMAAFQRAGIRAKTKRRYRRRERRVARSELRDGS